MKSPAKNHIVNPCSFFDPAALSVPRSSTRASLRFRFPAATLGLLAAVITCSAQIQICFNNDNGVCPTEQFDVYNYVGGDWRLLSQCFQINAGSHSCVNTVPAATGVEIRVVTHCVSAGGYSVFQIMNPPGGVVTPDDLGSVCPGDDKGGGGTDCRNSGCCAGMPVWSVSEAYTSIWIQDEPLGYKPAVGPPISLTAKIAFSGARRGMGACRESQSRVA